MLGVVLGNGVKNIYKIGKIFFCEVFILVRENR